MEFQSKLGTFHLLELSSERPQLTNRMSTLSRSASGMSYGEYAGVALAQVVAGEENVTGLTPATAFGSRVPLRAATLITLARYE